MLGKLSVALLIAAAPAVAAENQARDVVVDESGQAYKIKKVCRTVEVAGSFIPRTSCVKKKIPIRKPEAETAETAKAAAPGAEGSGEEKEQ